MVNLFDRGTAEAFSLSRPLIAEPDLVNRWASGDGEPANAFLATPAPGPPRSVSFIVSNARRC